MPDRTTEEEPPRQATLVDRFVRAVDRLEAACTGIVSAIDRFTVLLEIAAHEAERNERETPPTGSRRMKWQADVQRTLHRFKDICLECGGTGLVEDRRYEDGRSKTCEYCEGKGRAR